MKLKATEQKPKKFIKQMVCLRLAGAFAKFQTTPLHRRHTYILYHLKPAGRAGVVLVNDSISSSQNNQGAIRRAMIEADAIDCMVALPPQLFFNTQIPACLWFLAKDKRVGGRDRRGETLFIDARKLGRMENRVNRVFD